MNPFKKAISIAYALASMSLLVACASLRSDIDESCVARFADQYPVANESRLALPWPVGQSYTLTQGNCTFESHSLAKKQHMAFDFKMPIGTPIVAADDGRVFLVVEQFRDNVDKAYDEANYIGIEHDGGLLTWYMHLTFDGAAVGVDDQVARGDTIGYSGNTGDSSYPHLHFFAQQIIEKCHDADSKTADLALCPHVPVSFKNANPGDTVLNEWQTYEALAY